MSATYFEDDGVTVVISDIARQKLATEQRDFRHDQQRAEILTWSTAGALLGIAGLVLLKIWGG